MVVDSEIQHADIIIKNAKEVQNISSKIFSQKYSSNKKLNTVQDLTEMNKIMNNVVKTTHKAMKGGKFAESRVRARLVTVKKASSDTIKYTARAKRAAITSKKALQAAALTSKEMTQDHIRAKRLQTTYKIQVNVSLNAAKEAVKNSKRALKSSEIARAAARIPLEPRKM